MYAAYLIGCNKRVPVSLIISDSLDECCRLVEELYFEFRNQWYVIRGNFEDEEYSLLVKSPGCDNFEVWNDEKLTEERLTFFDGEIEYRFRTKEGRRKIVPLSMENSLSGDSLHPNEVGCCDLTITIHHIPDEYHGNILKYLKENITYLIV